MINCFIFPRQLSEFNTSVSTVQNVKERENITISILYFVQFREHYIFLN